MLWQRKWRGVLFTGGFRLKHSCALSSFIQTVTVGCGIAPQSACPSHLLLGRGLALAGSPRYNRDYAKDYRRWGVTPRPENTTIIPGVSVNAYLKRIEHGFGGAGGV